MNYDEILCRCTQEIKPSDIRYSFDTLEEMEDVISLGMGESDLVTPWRIRDTGTYPLKRDFTRYTSSTGVARLHREIMAYLNRRFSLWYDLVHQIVITVGGSGAIDLALQCILNPDDEVIIPVPSFACYESLAFMAGGTSVCMELKTENKFRLIAARLRAASTPCTKAVALPFLSGPTDGILEWADPEALVEILKNANAMALSDEIYTELTYGQEHMSFASLPKLYDRTTVVNGSLKGHAMTGRCTSYVRGLAPILQQMLKLHQLGIMSAPVTSQYAAIEIMYNGGVDTEKTRGECDSRRRYLVEGLRRIDLPCFESKGVFYVFPDVRGIGLVSGEFCERFLMEEKVAVIPGSVPGPGGEGSTHYCCITSMKDVAEVLTRVDNFLINLHKKQARKG